jgi:RNA polymerase sigma-70 factor (ECF subfamily)
VPARPEAWLVTAARRALGHARRHGAVREAAAATLAILHEEVASRARGAVPDERLGLLFVCAHPAIDEGVRTPLMLQAVLGLDAARVAAAFLASPAAMSGRLVRAKAKIRDAGLRVEPPDPDELGPRLEAVLAAIYAAFGSGFDDPADRDGGGLAAEAIHLARLVTALLPHEPEAQGLLALMLHVEARAAARRGPDGAFVPLDRQDPRLWSRPLIVEAEEALARAARARRFGRFQTEAAIQSVHAGAGLSGRANPRALVALHDLLAAHAPSIGAGVARAAVHGDAFGPAAGLALLAAIDPAGVAAYQPYWAVRAHLLAGAGRAAEARGAYARAIALVADPALKIHLAERAAALG